MQSLHLSLLAIPALLVACQHHGTLPPDVATVLDPMTSKLASVEALTLEATRHYDASLIVSTEIKPAVHLDLTLRRPAHIHATNTDADGSRTLVADGKELLFVEKGKPGFSYALEALPASNLATLSDDLAIRFGFTPPLSDLLAHDVAQQLREDLKSAKLLGKETVENTPCTHIRLALDGVSWEIWVADTDHLPRRMTIIYHLIEGKPVATYDFKNWNLSPHIPADSFSTAPPAGATKIRMVPYE